ncbi:DUF4276 family protein [Aphanizomenon flos-aquae NRERC-008]|jgi:hypothetical protein|uniref:DUF4276 family protein n=1 Tax=Aphanizomenon flos-aquae FACHB-1249 TaxID=2692889 RepID=A0ABR8IUR3_APHFL|nr:MULTISPECIES: DUF4276 family protein [Aphanizomenon]MBD2391910.1 DUF4276 family protein [Aphanizomenon flos-aquae FACHB-1171]MBD2558138.1 DUF4276 family protein [Aphanizomenon flos-aquae FACHB-1290]MBD2633445.1 DUF4276 family protein [Aphanizomenon sp. FACHB-1399]MBD2643727.1 DUF4276 family protein [Aphanizomenon sp. FACHB-1401]MBD2658342.1 DUF4276 family protein [Aphanizomenon flos-aquae FACHB-1265]
MVKEVRIHIEGGGDSKNQKSSLRQGFSKFFKELVNETKSKKIECSIIMCGTRNHAFRDFKNALESHPDAFNILLVDAEARITKNSPWEHLKFRDNWDKPTEVNDDNCHLMVQTMEAWFIADIDALKTYYRQGFKVSGIPKTPHVETIAKDDLERIIKIATANTSKKEYHKINHASELLGKIDANKVRQASPYCDRIFTTIQAIIDVSNNNHN